MLPNKNETSKSIKRIRLWYGLLVLVFIIFGVRLFYLQVINHGHYRAAALSGQLKQYEIPATRGVIKAHDGGSVLPIVLNQQLFTLYADPVYVKKADETAGKLAAAIGGDVNDYKNKITTKDTRYVILAKKLSAEQSKQIEKLKLPGIGTQAQPYRTYAQGSLLSQVLGFVNDEGKGKYGVEQALNKQLSGTPGEMKAITDARGVPLAASRDNVRTAPKNGKDVVLTIDLAMQQQLELIIEDGIKRAKASSVNALIMDPYTGAIKAMANAPTFDPAKYTEVDNASVFQNGAVTHSIEVGSTMKVLTTAAALDIGVVKPSTTYYDPASWKVDDFRITNIEEDGGAGTRSVADILDLSLNTGVTWLLMQMGGGQINEKARQSWYGYMHDRYQFGKSTGIEQGYESSGSVPEPKDNGAGINLTYANTSFGQAMTATPVQMGGALSAAINGGTYFQPRLVDQIIENGRANKVSPKIVKQNVVKPETSQQIIPLMQHVISKRSFNPKFDLNAYSIGGKTGTAQIAKPGGGYYEDKYNGTYVGFVGGAKPDYVIVVFVEKPGIPGYAGSQAAQPIFADLARMLINNSHVLPKQ